MLSEMPDTSHSDVPAARNSLRVLTYIARHSGPVRASTMARDLGLPRSSAYQLIAVMMEEGFLVYYPEDHTYGLSTLLSEIGTSELKTARLARLAQPLLERMVAASSVPVVAHLAVMAGADVTYVSKVQGFRAPTTVSSVGVRLPAHLTATGRAFLAGMPPSQVTALYPHDADLVQRSGRGPRTRSELDGILNRCLRDGWATEVDEITAEYSSVGAASYDANTFPIAALGLTYRATSVSDTAQSDLGRAVKAAADALTSRLVSR
jgi:DNA-binding IclR family transcriptional regulator